MATLDQDDLNNIVAALLAAMSPVGSLVLGNGTGSVEYSDYLLGPNNTPITNVIIRVFPYDNGVVDFTTCVARTAPEADGRFVFYLDPDSYIMRIERGSTLVLAEPFIVTPAWGIAESETVYMSDTETVEVS